MSEKEMDTRRMIEQLKKLPEKAQERIGYMIEGAHLVHDNRVDDPGDAKKGA